MTSIRPSLARLALTGAAFAIGLGPLAVSAQTPEPASGQVYSLTPEQKEEALASATPRRAAPTVETLDENGNDRRIHGEVGAMIGTGGARGMYGTAAIPLGENGGAIVSFEHSQFGDRRRH